MEPLTLYLIFAAIIMSIYSILASLSAKDLFGTVCYLCMGGCMLLLFYCVHQIANAT